MWRLLSLVTVRLCSDWFVTCSQPMSKSRYQDWYQCNLAVISVSPASQCLVTISLPSAIECHSSLWPRQVIKPTTLQQTTRNTETFCPNLFRQQKYVEFFVTKYLFFIAYFPYSHIMYTVYYVYCISWVYKGTKKFTYKYNLCVNSSWKETFLQSIMRNEGVFLD